MRPVDKGTSPVATYANYAAALPDEVEQPRLPFDDFDDDLPDEGPDSDDYSELDFDDWDRDEGHIYESIEDEIGDDLDQLDAEFDAE